MSLPPFVVFVSGVLPRVPGYGAVSWGNAGFFRNFGSRRTEKMARALRPRARGDTFTETSAREEPVKFTHFGNIAEMGKIQETADMPKFGQYGRVAELPKSEGFVQKWQVCQT